MSDDLLPARLLWGLLGAVIYPLWLAAGVADVWVHRRDRIECRTGTRESAMHLLMCLQMGVPVLAVLFLDVTAPVFLLCAALVLLHGWTSWRDSRFADSVRRIGPTEQKIHVALDAVPWIGLALVALLHREALAPLVQAGTADWSVRWREPPFAVSTIVAVLASSVVFGVLPSALELLRARRTVRRPAL
ncbi:MAG TPA: hypothetical protein VFE72_00640 [Lysobacter sp.]|nr:hypothetical protein [Lysobacter sp.]